jgi:hypothetical protein
MSLKSTQEKTVIDRSIRKLDRISYTGSSMRVIDLVKINQLYGTTLEYKKYPLFNSRILNQSIIVKHRLRSNEAELFEDARAVATKLIIPLDRNDLRAGGQYVFIGQKGEQAMMKTVLNDQSKAGARDLRTLAVLDALPSFDPFLVREHLRRDGLDPAPCYFEVSRGDMPRMLDFVRWDVAPLGRLSLGPGHRAIAAGSGSPPREDLAEKLMSNALLEELEPLRLAMQMAMREFADGVFAWRGMLYYKWVFSELKDTLPEVISEIRSARPFGYCDLETLRLLNTSRRRITDISRRSLDQSRDILTIYDRAFAGLTERNRPLEFRDFLLAAPQLFTELGERLSVLNHVVSFWTYRTANAEVVRITADELCDIVVDFEIGLASSSMVTAKAPRRLPAHGGGGAASAA